MQYVQVWKKNYLVKELIIFLCLLQLEKHDKDLETDRMKGKLRSVEDMNQEASVLRSYICMTSVVTETMEQIFELKGSLSAVVCSWKPSKMRAKIGIMHLSSLVTHSHTITPLTPLGNKPFENTVGKGEIARNCLPFSSNLKLSSATLSVWKSLKFVIW